MDKINNELLVRIFMFLREGTSVFHALSTCKRWHMVINSAAELWQQLCIDYLPDFKKNARSNTKKCRKLLKRKCQKGTKSKRKMELEKIKRWRAEYSVLATPMEIETALLNLPLDFTIKVVLAGNNAVGKTCSLSTYTGQPFPSPGSYIPTVFDQHIEKRVFGTKTISFELCDMGNTDPSNRLRPLTYLNADIVIINFDMTNRESYDKVTETWFPEVSHFCNKIPFILAGSKMDLLADVSHIKSREKGSTLTFQDGNDLAEKIGAAAFIPYSSRTHENLQLLFDEAFAFALVSKHRRKQSRKCVCQ